MSRHARSITPGSVQHVTTRFVDHAFRLSNTALRCDYLARLGRALVRSDWRLLGYALMSSHVHLVLVAGVAPLGTLCQRVHTGFALALNRREGRLGPVFAQRPSAVGLGPARAEYVLAYVHNNPVRARVVPAAAESTWTSHRAYLGAAPSPPWLDVARGLTLSGFDSSDAGRAAFDAMVRARAGDPRDPELAGRTVRAMRREARRVLGSPVELAGPRVEDTPAPHTMVCEVRSAGSPLRPRWAGPLRRVLEQTAMDTQVPVAAMCSRTRVRTVVEARRVALVAGVQHLGRGVTEVGASLGLSASAASRLLSHASTRAAQVDALAVQIAMECRRRA